MDTDTLAVEPAVAESSAEPVDQAEPQAESAPAAEPEAKPERDKVQERFDKLTREKYEALRAKDALEWELQRLREQAEKAQPEPVAPAKVPSLSDYDFDENQYQAAMVQYAAAEARKAALETLETQRRESEAKARIETWRSRESKFSDKTPDYRESVSDPTLPINQSMANIIADMEDGPAVAYYLAKNRDMAEAISKLPPMVAARELGKIEARLAIAPPKSAPVSSAPPPPPRIDASAATVSVKTTDPESDKLTDAEWMRRRDKELKRKGK